MPESSSFQATMNLREQLPRGLTLEALEAATAEEIDACICKVGFHNTKCDSLLPEVFWPSTAGQTDGTSLYSRNRAKNLKLLATRLREHHGGDVPSELRKGCVLSAQFSASSH